MLATNLDGLIDDFPRHGFFFGETRVLSRFRYFVDGKAPQTVEGCRQSESRLIWLCSIREIIILLKLKHFLALFCNIC